MVVTTYDDLENRFIEYNSRVYPSHQRARTLGRRLANGVSEHFHEQLVLPSQIRAIAYLLGFEDHSIYADVSPLGVSSEAYHSKIEPEIPQDGRVDISALITNPKKGGVAFKRTAVEQAFQKLAEQQKLDYSPERFQIALERV